MTTERKPNPFLGMTIGIHPNFHKQRQSLIGVPKTNRRDNLRGKSTDRYASVQSGQEGINVTWTGFGGSYFVPLYLLADVRMPGTK